MSIETRLKKLEAIASPTIGIAARLAEARRIHETGLLPVPSRVELEAAIQRNESQLSVRLAKARLLLVGGAT